MDGSIVGNILGIGYCMLYQLLGIGTAWSVIEGEKKPARMLIGSVLGSVCMMCLPALFALGMGFGLISHIAAVSAMGLACLCLVLRHRWREGGMGGGTREGACWKEHAYLLLALPLFLFFVYLLSTHAIPYGNDGSMRTGQSTNSDINRHLALITSIARQGDFPPEYSLLPGRELSYPILCDSVSSSLLVLGGSLRTAYRVPMAIAALQLMVGVLMLGRALLGSRRKAMLAWAFFFFNGGFGIFYFLRGITGDKEVFTRMFTEFYQTPTNFLDKNIRWNNLLVDLVLPQRDTLLGWSVLIPAIYLLYRGIQRGKGTCFAMAGVLGGCLPMVHIHSFLALSCICAMWLIYSLRTEVNPSWRNKASKIELWILFLFFFTMCTLDLLRRQVSVPNICYLALGIGVVVAVAVTCAVLAFRGWRSGGRDSLVVNWGIFLGIFVILALPQLIFWIFSQTQGGQLVRGHFNWSNISDTYLFFYFKNMGLVWLLGIVALIFTRSRNYAMVAPSFLLWSLAELIAFQPNEHDNDKLLCVAYLFLCMFVADYVIEICRKRRGRRGNVILVAAILFVSGISAVLSMGREMVSDYQLYGSNEVRMCKYIEENTSPEDVILTDTRYNNGVASLTGRTIVCGSPSFLHYQGLDFADRVRDVDGMYANPGNMDLFDKYGVEYVYVGNSERRRKVMASEEAFLENFVLVHHVGGVRLYQRIHSHG